MKQTIQTRWMLLLALVLLVSACAAPPPPQADSATEQAAPSVATETTPAVAPSANLTDGCVENHDPAIDYFPQKTSVTVSSGFAVEYHNNYKVVTVTSPWQGSQESFRYVLVQCGTPAPDGVEGAVVEVPVQTLVALSTTYLPHLASLGLVDRLVGLDSLLWTTTPEVVERIQAGKIAEVGGGSSVNVEQLLDMEPGLVMAYGMGVPEWDSHPLLLEAGIPTALNGDFVEQDPLGRTEWIKFLAFFFNKEREATQIFDETVASYQATAGLAMTASVLPTVFLSSIYDGTWWMPGGESYTAKLLADAGAVYLWADSGAVGSESVDFESVFEKAGNADFWLNPDNTAWNTQADVLQSDERYGEFAAVANGHLYNNNAQVNANGGNAFYESGAAHPDVVLMDLVKILHPELLPDHQLVYYKVIE
ncbi:MAG: ABC transporter substrate-binding protein [Caldilineaceae bacterium]|nr:ABC transporter substrate-binding protein [Caldilineaceae bacterium]